MSFRNVDVQPNCHRNNQPKSHTLNHIQLPTNNRKKKPRRKSIFGHTCDPTTKNRQPQNNAHTSSYLDPLVHHPDGTACAHTTTPHAQQPSDGTGRMEKIYDQTSPAPVTPADGFSGLNVFGSGPRDVARGSNRFDACDPAIPVHGVDAGDGGGGGGRRGGRSLGTTCRFASVSLMSYSLGTFEVDAKNRNGEKILCRTGQLIE